MGPLESQGRRTRACRLPPNCTPASPARHCTPPTPRCARTRPRSARRSRPRTTSSRACRTSAPRNGISRTRPGSSRTSCSQPFLPGYRSFHPRYGYLFNSYYETVGPFFPRLQRGLLARPTVEEIYRYRDHVDACMKELIDRRPCRALGRDRRSRDARAPPRAAAPGTAPHRHQAHIRGESPAPGLSRAARGAPRGSRRDAVHLAGAAGGRLRDRPRRRRLRFRQRGAAPPRLSQRVSHRRAPRHQRRVPRIHGGRRLPQPGAVAVARLADRARARLAGAALLGERRAAAGRR